MYSPTTRLLTVLELLQSQRRITGPELAERLEVGIRSVRRYVTMLRDLGIPVESEPGRYGTYYLRPGFRLPPMMFTNPEMLAVILGLMAAQHLGLSGALGVESVLAKIERVLPEELRGRVEAVQRVLSLDLKPHRLTASEHLIGQFIEAACQHHQVWIEYQGTNQERTERILDVYGLVYHLGYWYAVAYCHLRAGIRNFRLDRVRQVKTLDTTFVPPDSFKPLSHLWASIATIPHFWQVEVLLLTTWEDAQARVPPDAGVLDPVKDGVILRCQTSILEWMARFLVGLDCPLQILNPPELRVELRHLSARILAMAADPDEHPVHQKDVS